MYLFVSIKHEITGFDGLFVTKIRVEAIQWPISRHGWFTSLASRAFKKTCFALPNSKPERQPVAENIFYCINLFSMMRNRTSTLVPDAASNSIQNFVHFIAISKGILMDLSCLCMSKKIWVFCKNNMSRSALSTLNYAKQTDHINAKTLQQLARMQCMDNPNENVFTGISGMRCANSWTTWLVRFGAMTRWKMLSRDHSCFGAGLENRHRISWSPWHSLESSWHCFLNKFGAARVKLRQRDDKSAEGDQFCHYHQCGYRAQHGLLSRCQEWMKHRQTLLYIPCR